MDKKILIGLPCQSGVVPLPMVQSLLELHKPATCAFLSIERQRIDKVRSYMAVECIKGGFDYLMMIDDDNPIPPDTLEKFIEDDKDVVIAPILSRNPNVDGKHDLCAYYVENRLIKKEYLRMYNYITKFKEDGYLHQIDAGGTGCILIKRAVLEAIKVKHDNIFEFGDITVEGQRRTMSEDCEFCERAVDAGFEIWLDDRITPIHLSGVQAVRWERG